MSNTKNLIALINFIDFRSQSQKNNGTQNSQSEKRKKNVTSPQSLPAGKKSKQNTSTVSPQFKREKRKEKNVLQKVKWSSITGVLEQMFGSLIKQRKYTEARGNW